nr:GNAT family N-acetyltransferase [Nostoc sp. ChiQUE02]MDZ8234014.1 GNAT family N-acetyltransferase [Nostoc sp. ChiQUE02]
MNIEIQEIQSPDQIRSKFIGERAKGCKTRITRCFIATCNDIEVAFFALDLWPVPKPLILYELYVEPNMRNRGIGSRVLVEVEALATRMGYQKVILKPKPLDDTYSPPQLVDWYKRRGYDWSDEECEKLQKYICPFG